VRRYLLTPRGRVANLALAMLLVLVLVATVQNALEWGGWAWALPALVVALLLGALAHTPMTYVIIALNGMIGMAASLNRGEVAHVLGSVLLVALAVFIRSQILERTAAPPADAPPT
jgi:glucan phosphoethanolaminetransferase (alkaline phosphatase superfamily)